VTAPYRHSSSTRRVLEALVSVVCPPEADQLGVTGAVVDHAGETMAALPALFRRGLVMGLATFDQSARLWPPARGRSFHGLPVPLRERWYRRWLEGRTPASRELAKGIKQILALSYYEMPLVQERLGYLPDRWIEKVKRRRLEVYADDIAAHQASLTAPDPLPRRKPEEVR
jgi:hypothetical protein